MSQRLTIAGRIVSRTVTDLALAIGATEILGLLFDVFDSPVEEDINDINVFLKNTLFLFIQATSTVLIGYELKDFFYDNEATDYTDSMLYNFLLMYQPKMLWRVKKISKFIATSFGLYVSKIKQ